MPHRSLPGEMDATFDRIENTPEQIEINSGAVAAPNMEQNLLRLLDDLRRSLHEAQQAGDKTVGECVRIGRARAILEGLRYEMQTKADKRDKQALKFCKGRNVQAAGFSNRLTRTRDPEWSALFDRIKEEFANRMLVVDEDGWDIMSKLWADHPGQSLQVPHVQFDDTAPAALCGHLWKKSPAPAFPIKRWKSRWIELAEGRIKWYAWEAEDKYGQWKLKRGEIDFDHNPCLVSLENGDSQFSIRPLAGKWISGGFTGAAIGRKFDFDCHGSQHGRDEWVYAINSHIKHGTQVCG